MRAFSPGVGDRYSACRYVAKSFILSRHWHSRTARNAIVCLVCSGQHCWLIRITPVKRIFRKLLLALFVGTRISLSVVVEGYLARSINLSRLEWVVEWRSITMVIISLAKGQTNILRVAPHRCRLWQWVILLPLCRLQMVLPFKYIVNHVLCWLRFATSGMKWREMYVC